MSDERDVLSALIDREPVDPDVLARVLEEPANRALLVDFVRTRARVQQDEPGEIGWLLDPVAAWVPVVLADVWKHTPFVALLLLAGLQGIDPELYQAARIDGASAWGQFRYITLPLLRPAILVTLIFRSLDAFRVFDLIYALTGGGPGSSTESLGLYTFNALLQNLRFGYGSALSVIAFALTFLLALAYIRLLGSLAGASR